MIDRDFSGTEVSHHDISGDDGVWAYGQPHYWTYGKGALSSVTGCIGCINQVPPDFSETLMANAVRQDGYQIGNVTIQGVRAYDSGTAQWTAPDAYKGNVQDPMSQRSYMWNNNNPVSYSDPSGYDPMLASRQKQIRRDVDSGMTNGWNSADEAAYAANYKYANSPNQNGPQHGKERGTTIYEDKATGKYGFTPLGSSGGWGSSSGWDPASAPPTPAGGSIVAFWHVHPPDPSGITTPRASMLDHAQEVGLFGHPIYTGFSDRSGLLFVQEDANFNHHPSIATGSLPYMQGDPYQYEVGH